MKGKKSLSEIMSILFMIIATTTPQLTDPGRQRKWDKDIKNICKIGVQKCHHLGTSLDSFFARIHPIAEWKIIFSGGSTSTAPRPRACIAWTTRSRRSARPTASPRQPRRPIRTRTPPPARSPCRVTGAARAARLAGDSTTRASIILDRLSTIYCNLTHLPYFSQRTTTKFPLKNYVIMPITVNIIVNDNLCVN